MPKWEIEPLLIMGGRHPADCTCQDCANRFLRGRNIETRQDNSPGGESVAKHPADRGPGGFLKRLFRLKRPQSSK